MSHILIYGNPIDGFNYVGPFKNSDAALHYMKTEPHKSNIWMVMLQTPSKEDLPKAASTNGYST
jgi:hypothetical protein